MLSKSSQGKTEIWWLVSFLWYCQNLLGSALFFSIPALFCHLSLSPVFLLVCHPFWIAPLCFIRYKLCCPHPHLLDSFVPWWQRSIILLLFVFVFRGLFCTEFLDISSFTCMQMGYPGCYLVCIQLEILYITAQYQLSFIDQSLNTLSTLSRSSKITFLVANAMVDQTEHRGRIRNPA